ncbi:hypothetical protein B7802_07440 [Salmonella enterica]|nr:hypothetical protein [Salmonella enterica]ECW0264952.1 hypothetical protein [Salmonella enterica subsp. diarizonae]EBD5983675.1 hypothetical protein [Salmonella enterica]EBI4324799.1 hypothetical protein [Salmonella enterica]ECO4385965.1 hypothetical protein [Salmonella enterica]
MNKFEGVTVVHIEGADYTQGKLNPAVDKETVTADIVIDGGKVIKNRIFNEDVNNKYSGKLENAQKLSAVLSALYFSWVELAGEDIDVLIYMASEYAGAIKSHLTEMAEGEK